MKFGEYLHAQKLPEWENYYLNYDRLKQMIEELEELNLIALSTTSKGILLFFYRLC
jgi:SPX domain protein involved in polyphosphate accumulation